jgi:hypothetical protein
MAVQWSAWRSSPCLVCGLVERRGGVAALCLGDRLIWRFGLDGARFADGFLLVAFVCGLVERRGRAADRVLGDLLA